MIFYHIGIAVRDIGLFKESLRKIFNIISSSEIIYDPEQEAYVCMIELENGPRLELIQGKIVENIIKRGLTYYHLCFTTSNLENEIQHLLLNKAILVKGPKASILFNGKRVAFLYTELGLIELLEEK